MSERLTSFRSMYSPVLQFWPSAANRTGNLEASNFVISATPEVPAISASQVAATELPTGVTKPIPVTTTLRAITQRPFRSDTQVRRRQYGASPHLHRESRC